MITGANQDSEAQVADVVILGAGFGGICAAIKLREKGIDNILILEKAAGIGGTWWHNTYPGAACDIASHLYCYSFEPNPDWSRKYAPQAEIQAYIEHCADKYDVRRHVRLDTEVTALQFCDKSQLWLVHTRMGDTLTARHVVFATGGLHLPAFPDIPGSDNFQGTTMHSAQWNHDVDFVGKRVAVIGSAASAIQLIPELAKVAAKVDVYQRTPNYIAARNDRPFRQWEKSLFRHFPWISRLYRKLLFLRGELILFRIVKTRGRSGLRDKAERFIRRHIRNSVSDVATQNALIPHYPMGCKRILIADNFYETLNRPNVRLITEAIQRISAAGVITEDETERSAHILVYATGFDIENYMRNTEVTGPGGVTLSELWADLPQAYKGGFVPGLPNFYLTTGPNTGLGTNSVIQIIEAQVHLILQAVQTAGREKLIEVTDQAAECYNNRIRRALQDTVWAGDCQSWYKRPDGEITTLYPFDVRTFAVDHRQLEISDFIVKPRRHQV